MLRQVLRLYGRGNESLAHRRVIPDVRSMPLAPARHAPDRADAFAELYASQFDRLYAFVRFRTGDATSAEDIAAEVFARAWTKVKDPTDRDAAVAWLFVTARRLVIDRYRRRRPIIPIGVPGRAEPSAPPPEDAVIAAERRALLDRSIAGLSERERDVIGLRFVARRRNPEIAAIVGTSAGNVAKILHRALRKVRVELVAQGFGVAKDGEG